MKKKERRIYEVEIRGFEWEDMYEIIVEAEDIKGAYKKALKRLDKKDDVIMGLYERI